MAGAEGFTLEYIYFPEFPAFLIPSKNPPED